MKNHKIFWYKVVWEEQKNVIVAAKNEEEAVEMVHQGDYDEAEVSTEVSVSPEAFKIEKVE